MAQRRLFGGAMLCVFPPTFVVRHRVSVSLR